MTAQEAFCHACGRIAFLSAMSALTLFVALHFLNRELDPSWRMVSEYALGKQGWAMVLCFLLLALGCVLSVLATYPFIHTTGGKVGLFLLVCAAAGLALASAFPTDPIAVSPGEASRAARLHGFSVMVGVPTLTVAALLISFTVARDPFWTDARLPLLGFAHLTWISLVLTIAVVSIWMPRNGGFGPSVPVGWPNRLMFIAYFGWLGSLAWPFVR